MNLVRTRFSLRGRRSVGRGFSAISLAVLGLLTATVSPAEAATSASGPGVSQENTHDPLGSPGFTGGNGTTREGCVKYSSSVFHLTWNSGSVNNGSLFNAGPANPFFVTLTVASASRYEGPHGTYDSSVANEVKFGDPNTNPTDHGCLRSEHGRSEIASTVTLSVVRTSPHGEICDDGVGTPGTTTSGSIRRGDFDSASAQTPPDPDDGYYTVKGQCKGIPFTAKIYLSGACVAPIAPAACLVTSSTIDQ